MPSYTAELGLIHGVVDDDEFPPAQQNSQSDLLEIYMMVLLEKIGNGVLKSTQFNGTAVTGQLELDISLGYAITGGALARRIVYTSGVVRIGTTEGLAASSTNYIYVHKSSTPGDLTPVFEAVQTDGTQTAGGTKILTCVTGASDVTSVNQNPSGRVNIA